MNQRRYRICLLMVIAMVIVSGILYYQFYKNKEQQPKDSVLVWAERNGCEAV